MSAAQSVTQIPCNCGRVSVRVFTDPPGRTETPALLRPRLAIHLGRSVYMVCQHGKHKHRGWGVHGDIDIVPAGTPCVWEPDGPDTALIVGMDPDLLTEATEELGLNADRLEILNRFQIRDAQIEHICWALKAEMEVGFPTGRLFLDSLSTALAAVMVRRHSSHAIVPFPSNQSLSGRSLRQALSYIEDNLKRDLSLSEIAQAADVSVTHLKTAFRQMTGTPVHQYVIQRRVERAKILLAAGKCSISEVAQETGFAHQSHLAKHMRRLLGYSPKAVRYLNR
jgi:AraC family transcriptional regulator